MARAHGAWVRLHYVYPYPHVDDVIGRMTTDPAAGGLLPYLDVPFQHASPRILKLMKRPANAEGTLRRIEAWRAMRPDLVIRSTFIAGFPGETEAEFGELLAFLEAARARPRGLLRLLARRRRRGQRAAGSGGARGAGRPPRAIHGGAGEDQRPAPRAARRNDDDRAGRRPRGKARRSRAAPPMRRRSTASSASRAEVAFRSAPSRGSRSPAPPDTIFARRSPRTTPRR